MKQCIIDAYNYYHNPLHKQCETEFKTLPVLFGRKRKEEAIREKYEKLGLKVIRYEDLQKTVDGVLDHPANHKPCAEMTRNGSICQYYCGIDGSEIGLYEERCQKIGCHCEKLQNFLWADLFD